MYLKYLEIQGFKTFADKTKLEFAPQQAMRAMLPMTAVVGPNGSGKSNIADAIRWVLGEQSMKAVRGKKSDDVIFFGTPARARASMAYVAMTLDNADGKLDVPYAEVTLSRRLYRDGTSEYALNHVETRLSDITLLLAKAGVNTESYTVIAQGMIDQLLTMSPEERKRMFAEATGVRPLEIKKEQALRKIKTTEENISRATLLLDEIGPRLKTLARQVKKLNEREGIESALNALAHSYYRTQLEEIGSHESTLTKQKNEVSTELAIKNREYETIRDSMNALEHSSAPAPATELDSEYEKLLRERDSLREKEITLRARAEVSYSSPQKMAIVPPEMIRAELGAIRALHATIKEKITAATSLDELKTIGEMIHEADRKVHELLSLFPEVEQKTVSTTPPSIPQEIIDARTLLDKRIEELRAKQFALRAEVSKDRSRVFDVQRQLETKQREIHSLESRLHEASIELAKITTRRETLEAEMLIELTDAMRQKIKTEDAPTKTPEELRNDALEIRRLKGQLEWIGGIDPEVLKEHNETEERFNFLTTQTTDLAATLISLGTMIKELDTSIESQFKEAFTSIQEKFNHYFGILFTGGQAKLTLLEAEAVPAINEDGAVAEESETNEIDERVRGIDIQAVPAGKRFKSIHMLSGGEKALTAIALLAAILSYNPPPFIVLDEVDAALDEANSERFAKIVHELAQFSQFIVITHNRATMHEADLLYGVTMGSDGVSKILSLELTAAEASAA